MELLTCCSSCGVRKGTGSHVLGSWNKEVRGNSGLYRVREAAAAAVHSMGKQCSYPICTFGYCRVLKGAR